ncbi:hypothetical protein ACFQ0T_36200 [Kitasatospora gansuensis]
MNLWIAGAGVGREALDTALAAGVPVAGFLDDRGQGGTVRGLPVRAPKELPPGAAYLIGIADPAVRARLSVLLDGLGGRAETLVHPRAIVAPETELGPGCLVMGARTSPAASGSARTARCTTTRRSVTTRCWPIW